MLRLIWVVVECICPEDRFSRVTTHILIYITNLEMSFIKRPNKGYEPMVTQHFLG